ncbi:MAG: ComF family protein [Planctomycetes bacterium]|nr:ComF family protein [Planctomycetota bacterium]MCC7170263.1 ComF family protein [Planctomycetota bacterium]
MGPIVRLRAWLCSTLDLFFPRHCLGCESDLVGTESLVCGRCRVVVEQRNAQRCARCASEIDAARRTRASCRTCRDVVFAFRGAVAALRYRGPVRSIVLAIKFGRRAEGVEVLADRLADAILARRTDRRIDVVVPIPLHPLRRLVRGFDQAERLAVAVARRLQKPCVRLALRRARATRRQATLRRAERVRNVRTSFVAGWLAFRVRGRRVLLVDDVMTSGATAQAAAAVLLAAGARVVIVAVAARG